MKIKAWYEYGGRLDVFQRGHTHDAGLDIHTPPQVPIQDIAPHETRVIPTGLHIELPAGTMGQLIARTSIAKRGLHIASSPIDAGYTGEIHIIITNTSDKAISLPSGTRIAQLVVSQVLYIELVEDLGVARKAGAFGSTDK